MRNKEQKIYLKRQENPSMKRFPRSLFIADTCIWYHSKHITKPATVSKKIQLVQICRQPKLSVIKQQNNKAIKFVPIFYWIRRNPVKANKKTVKESSVQTGTKIRYYELILSDNKINKKYLMQYFVFQSKTFTRKKTRNESTNEVYTWMIKT